MATDQNFSMSIGKNFDGETPKPRISVRRLFVILKFFKGKLPTQRQFVNAVPILFLCATLILKRRQGMLIFFSRKNEIGAEFFNTTNEARSLGVSPLIGVE